MEVVEIKPHYTAFTPHCTIFEQTNRHSGGETPNAYQGVSQNTPYEGHHSTIRGLIV